MLLAQTRCAAETCAQLWRRVACGRGVGACSTRGPYGAFALVVALAVVAGTGGGEYDDDDKLKAVMS